MAEDTHRISLRDVNPEKYAQDWADVARSRSWGDSLAIQEAALVGVRAFQLTKVTRLVKDWSLPGHPSNEADAENADEHVMRFLIEEMDKYYAGQREEIENRRKAQGTS